MVCFSFSALWRITPEELVTLIDKLPAYLLTRDTACHVLHCWDILKHKVSANQEVQLKASLSRLRQKSHLQQPTHEVSVNCITLQPFYEDR